MLIGILIFQLLVNPTITEELLKLPSLMEHYYHHNHHHSHHDEHEHWGNLESHEEMNLMSFLDAHYGATSIDHSEDSHNELPFKNSSNNRIEQQSIHLFVFEQNNFEIQYFAENETKQPLGYASFLTSNYLQNIWQPPKIS
jgi:hypothetical protein